MENRKYVKFLAPLLLAGLFFCQNALAYQTSTHEYLTQKAVDFYNQKTTNKQKIKEQYFSFIKDGARREDDPPRWMNHFYDPIKNRGLTKDNAIDPLYNLGTWNKSKDWAQNDSEQKKIAYSPIIATILSSIQSGKIQNFLPTADFTYKQALKYWIRGDKEMAMFSLGHTIHLLEDTAVPDHTRNDPHIEGSPLEQYAGTKNDDDTNPNLNKNVNKLGLISFSSLNEYFDNLAKYSNENFYSKDTIGIQSGYGLPSSENTQLIGDSWYITNDDNNFGSYKLAQTSMPNKFAYILSNRKTTLIDGANNKVLSDYWDLLSPKAVAYSAGAIDLFFKDVEKYKNDPEFLKEEKGFFGQMWDATKGIYVNFKDYLASLFQKDSGADLEISLDNLSQSPSPTPKQSPINTNTPKPTPTETKTPNNSKLYIVTRVIDGDTIVLDDGTIVRYLGIDAPEFSEKKEKNDCLGKEARERNKELVLNKKIKLETSGAEFDDFDRKLAYVWVQPLNAGELEILANEKLIEEGLVYSFDFGHKHKLDDQFEKTESIAKEKKLGLWGSFCENQKEPIAEDSQKTLNKCEWKIGETPIRNKIILNEIAWMGGVDSASDEWIEIKNISGGKVDLDEWQIVNKSGNLIVDLSKLKNTTIESKGFLLFERTDDNSVKTEKADLIYSGGLSNTNEELRLFDDGCGLNDLVTASTSWPAGDNNDKTTMERDLNGYNWHTSSIVGGTPRKENTSEGGGRSSGNSNPGSSSSPTPTPTPNNYDIKINEIMYNPMGSDGDREWIELFNNGSEDVDVTKLKFFEGGVNHTISAVASGTNILGVGEYGVIVQNIDSFMEDFSSFMGKIFDSSFSLSNDGEELAIKNSDNILDSFIYSKTMGGDENGRSIQKFESGWEGAPPTPGKENEKEQAPLPGNETNADHIVISEIQVGGENSSDEFIELYNPTETPISLDGWSLQYLSGSAEIFTNPIKKNFTSGAKIEGKGFYLITKNGGKYSSMADMNQSTISLSGNASGGIIFLISTSTEIISLEDPRIVDMVGYGNPILSGIPKAVLPEKGKSIERTSIKDGNCVYPFETEEFDGNGCDRNAGEDFVIRSDPKPQNTKSLAEPRNAPETPQNFELTYSRDKVTLDMKWDASIDYRGSNEGLWYEMISDEGNIIASTTEKNINKRIKEIGKSYIMSLLAVDKDGKKSNASTLDVSVPSFVNGIDFFQNNYDGKKYINIKYDAYPFVPDSRQEYLSWKAMVFYKGEPPEFKNDYTNLEFDSVGNFVILGDKCIDSPGTNSGMARIILPDNASFCGNGGGVYNCSLSLRHAEDNNILLEVAGGEGAQFSSGDYITVAYYTGYGTTNGDGRYPNFELIALDKIPYHFLDSQPESLPPSAPKIISTEGDYNSIQSRFDLRWENSTDTDSLDNKIKYELRSALSSDDITSVEWKSVYSPKEVVTVVPGNEYVFQLRAIDDMGNYSEISEKKIKMPEVNNMPLELSNLFWSIDGDGTAFVQFDVSNYNTLVSTDLSLVAFYLNSDVPDKTLIKTAEGQIDDGRDKLAMVYNSCQNGPKTSTLLYLGGIISTGSCAGPMMDGLFRNIYDFDKGPLPNPGTIRLKLNRSDFSESDYITMLVLYKTQSGIEEYGQLARYLKPTYFSLPKN